MAKPAKTELAMLEQFEPDVFWIQHGRKILIAIGAIAVIGLGCYLWQQQSAREAESAAAALAQATNREALEQILRSYPGKEVAAQALLRLADEEFQAGKYAAATTAYQRLIDQFPKHSLAPSARLGLAAVQESEGKFEAARAQYRQILALDPTGYTGLAARMGDARCAEATGQVKEARQTYEEVMALAQGTPLQASAYIRWAVLGREQPPVPATIPTASLPGQRLSPATPAAPATPRNSQ